MNKPAFFHLAGLDEYYFTEGDWIHLANELYWQAPNYELPESKDDTERIRALEPLLDLADDYTSICIYGLDDGYYRTARDAKIWKESKYVKERIH